MAATLVVWLVAAEIAALAHQAAVAHQTCAEHGESIHVGAGAAAPGQAVSQGAAGAAEHDHCSVTPMAAGVAAHGAPRLTAAPSPQPSYLVIPPAAPPPAIAILLVAPKSSPPG